MAGLWINPTELNDASNPDAPYAARTASWLLYRLTGAKYPGVTTTSDWYGYATTQCMFGCAGSLAFASSIAAGVDGAFFDHSHVRYGSELANPRLLRTRGQPLIKINSISGGDGTSISVSGIKIVNHAYLVHTDSTPWDFYSGVVVNYDYGMLPPEAGRRAAKTLADEIVKCVSGDDTCRLPDRITSINREGLSMTVLDPQAYIKEGRTGIYEIDLFINAANPVGAHKKSRVYSPDVPRGERRIDIT